MQLDCEQAMKLGVVLGVFSVQESMHGVEMVLSIQVVADHVQ